jgi:hypothetical protein
VHGGGGKPDLFFKRFKFHRISSFKHFAKCAILRKIIISLSILFIILFKNDNVKPLYAFYYPYS